MNDSRLITRLLVFGLGSLALTACGSSVPGIGQVRADFQNPSGSVKDRQQLAAASVSQGASSDLSAIGAGLNFGQGLSAAPVTGLARLEYGRQFGPHLRALQDRLAGRSTRALSAQDASSCDDGEQISEAMARSLGSGGSSGSFDFSVDLSSCDESDLTGTIRISGSFDVDTGAQSFEFDVKQVFTQVCERDDERRCVSGEYRTEATFAAGKLDLTSAWSAVASWTEAGRAVSVKSKGGARIGLREDGSRAELEYLVYATLPDGSEVSFVLTIETQNGGTVIRYRGADGSIACTVARDGSGQCDGGLSWDADYADSFEDNFED